MYMTPAHSSKTTRSSHSVEITIHTVRAVDRQASGDPIRSTIHELRFTDRTASHWLIKKKPPVMKHLLLGLFT